jgi:hypothetical protein
VIDAKLHEYLISKGFTTDEDMEFYRHSNCLRITFSSEEWEVEDICDEWIKDGFLSDTSRLIEIIESL